mmetsp:Transcript_16058/g.60738  ORF Transcript_16058/g.60738 Transcript_16058/m.60738 type:complete len:241 (-) Transcript_16058:1655-2377(-)
MPPRSEDCCKPGAGRSRLCCWINLSRQAWETGSRTRCATRPGFTRRAPLLPCPSTSSSGFVRRSLTSSKRLARRGPITASFRKIGCFTCGGARASGLAARRPAHSMATRLRSARWGGGRPQAWRQCRGERIGLAKPDRASPSGPKLHQRQREATRRHRRSQCGGALPALARQPECGRAAQRASPSSERAPRRPGQSELRTPPQTPHQSSRPRTRHLLALWTKPAAQPRPTGTASALQAQE